MAYQNPQILYFLFALAVPIIIHLFNLRKNKVVYFSNVRFLKEIKSERKQKSILKQILILLSRLLALSAIILAFANPYIPNNNNLLNHANTVIYIDNSFSMDDISEKGRLLDVAKEKSLAIIENTDKSNKFWIITNDFNPKENLSKNKEESEKYILDIQSSPIIRSKQDILEKQKSLFSGDATIFMISDFQESSTNLSFLDKLDSSQHLVLVPLEKQINTNISIDSCWMESPINRVDKKMIIKLKISNHANKDISDIILNLEINQQHKTQQNISLLANQSKEVELFFSAENNINNGIISIEDHPITFDNTFYFSFKIDSKIDVCQVYEDYENKNIDRVFELEDIIEYSKLSINQMNYNKIKDQELIIINELSGFSSGFTNSVYNYLVNGGNVCIVPIKEANINNYNDFLNKINTDIISKINDHNIKVNHLNQKHSIFNNVFNSDKLQKNINLPSINYYYTLVNKHNTIKKNILTLETNNAFLNSYEVGKGEVYLFTSPLSDENNNFAKHALFVTSFFNMALNSVKSDILYYTIFRNQEIKLPKTNKLKQNIFHLKSEKKDIIMDYTSKNDSRYLLTHNQIDKAGHYNLLQEDQILNTLSFNYSREESNTKQYEFSEIKEFIKSNNLANINLFNTNKSIKNNIKSINNSKEYWKMLILIAILFISFCLYKIIQKV